MTITLTKSDQGQSVKLSNHDRDSRMVLPERGAAEATRNVGPTFLLQMLSTGLTRILQPTSLITNLFILVLQMTEIDALHFFQILIHMPLCKNFENEYRF